MLGICSGFEFFLGFCRYIIHFHQSFNPMFATRNTSVNQITINPWAAVAPSACVMKISYFFNYLFILKRSAALRCCNPCIITAFAYIHYLAYPRYGKFITLFHNEFVFHSCAFVNMPTAFFRMSRSCFTIANSFFSLLISLKSSELMVSVLPALSSVSNSLFHRSKLSLDIPRSPDISSDVFPLVFNSFTASSLNSLLYLFLVDIVSLHDILIFGLTECPQYQGNFRIEGIEKNAPELLEKIIQKVALQLINNESISQSDKQFLKDNLSLSSSIDYDIPKVEDKIIPKDIDRLLEILIKGLPRATYPLRNRRKGFNSILFDNEYDMQDLFHSLIRPWIRDIRKEEYTPSYAGNSTRVDFACVDYNIFIELKYIRDIVHSKKIGDELVIDIAHYRKHQNCNKGTSINSP